MIIRCSQCLKRYHLDTLSLGERGKKVRCTACRHTWFQKPEVEPKWDTAIDPSSNPEDTVSPPHPKKRFMRSIWFWIVLLALAAGSTFFLKTEFFLPHKILEPLHQIFGWVRREKGPALEIRQTKIQKMMVEGKGQKGLPTLLLSGVIVNNSAYVLSLPLLKISLFQNSSTPSPSTLCLMKQITHKLSQAEILPGEVLNFEVIFEHATPIPDSFSIEF